MAQIYDGELKKQVERLRAEHIQQKLELEERHENIMLDVTRLTAEINSLKTLQQAPANDLKTMLHDFLTSSWCIGIPQLVRAKNVLVKLIWLLAIMAGTALCSWFSINIFHDFYEFKFITESKIIYHESLAFPKVAICSDDGSVRYNSVMCTFDRIKCLPDFRIRSINIKGLAVKCFSFTMENSTVPFVQTKAGFEYGLEIKASVREGINGHFIIIEDIVESSFSFGKDLVIYNGEHMKIGMKKSSDTKLGMPYNQCINDFKPFDNSSLVSRTIQFNKIYRKDKCNKLCYFKNAVADFNCTFENVWPTGSGAQCGELRGFDSYYRNFNFTRSCSEVCPLECESEFYDLYVSQTQVSNVFDPSGNISFALNVYFTDLKVLKISQYAKTSEADLVSNIGGTLGLFIGFQIFSIVEILEFFVNLALKLGKKVKTYVNESK